MPHESAADVLDTLRQGLLWCRMEHSAWHDHPEVTDYARYWHGQLPLSIAMLEAIIAYLQEPVDRFGEEFVLAFKAPAGALVGEAVQELGYENLFAEFSTVSDPTAKAGGFATRWEGQPSKDIGD